MESLFEAAGGAEGMVGLASAWHLRVMADEVVSHAFSHGFHPRHTERLAAYFAEALGGPTTYTDRFGDESSVVRQHSGKGSHTEMDDRALACFDVALADIGLRVEDGPGRDLHAYFAWATSRGMAQFPQDADQVPDGLPLPHWSWDGPVPHHDG